MLVLRLLFSATSFQIVLLVKFFVALSKNRRVLAVVHLNLSSWFLHQLCMIFWKEMHGWLLGTSGGVEHLAALLTLIYTSRAHLFWSLVTSTANLDSLSYRTLVIKFINIRFWSICIDQAIFSLACLNRIAILQHWCNWPIYIYIWTIVGILSSGFHDFGSAKLVGANLCFGGTDRSCPLTCGFWGSIH